jgi:hypothetical protein
MINSIPNVVHACLTTGNPYHWAALQEKKWGQIVWELS